MSEQETPHHSTVKIAADIGAAAVAIGVLQERVAGLRTALEHHMREEHEDFRKALVKVEELHETVRDLHAAARVTRWIAAGVSGVAGIFIWVKDHIRIF